MILSVMQPTYLPWCGYFELMQRSDHFVFLDTVEFSKQSFQQRNQIKTQQGPLLLTIPVIQKMGQLICEVKTDSRSQWNKKHWRSIEFAYSKAPHWNLFSPKLAAIYENPPELLSELNMKIILTVKELLGITTATSVASQLNIQVEDRIERLLRLCKHYNASVYYSPAGAKDYMESELNVFRDNEIEVRFQNYRHPVYNQRFGDFIDKMSVIDALFNLGPNTLETIMKES